MSAIGHNSPPPREAHALHIEELYQTASDFLDGEPIATEGQANEVGKLIAALREARKGADEQRAIEKRPHDEAAKEVQTAWKPLIDRCDRATQVAKNALVPWQLKIEAEQRAEAARLAKEADDARIAAQAKAEAQRGSGRLEDAEEAEAALKAADKLTKAAARADKAKPLVATGGRSIGLRSDWVPELTDATAALKHYMARQPDALKAWLMDQARKDIRGGARSIPGFNITEERKAA